MCRLSWNLGASTSWKPQGLSRPVMGLLYLYYYYYYCHYYYYIYNYYQSVSLHTCLLVSVHFPAAACTMNSLIYLSISSLVVHLHLSPKEKPRVPVSPFHNRYPTYWKTVASQNMPGVRSTAPVVAWRLWSWPSPTCPCCSCVPTASPLWQHCHRTPGATNRLQAQPEATVTSVV